MHILVVEDNPVNSKMICRRLSKRGYTTTTAFSGEEGVEAAQSTQPDLILMDVGLPGIDGLETTRILKTISSTHDIPIIAVTAHAMRDDQEAALAAGCSDYTTKPIIFDSLIEKIEVLRDKA